MSCQFKPYKVRFSWHAGTFCRTANTSANSKPAPGHATKPVNPGLLGIRGGQDTAACRANAARVFDRKCGIALGPPRHRRRTFGLANLCAAGFGPFNDMLLALRRARIQTGGDNQGKHFSIPFERGGLRPCGTEFVAHPAVPVLSCIGRRNLTPSARFLNHAPQPDDVDTPIRAGKETSCRRTGTTRLASARYRPLPRSGYSVGTKRASNLTNSA